MEIQRAKEIITSPVMADVTLNNQPVYLEKVDDQQKTCTVHYIENPDHQECVSVSKLIEH